MINLEVILKNGKREGMVKSEIKVDGRKAETDFTEVPESLVAKATKNLYEQLSRRELKTWSFVNYCVDKAVYEKIREDISKEIPNLNAHYN